MANVHALEHQCYGPMVGGHQCHGPDQFAAIPDHCLRTLCALLAGPGILLSLPEWFRDAKFGIWAVFGPQCEPEDGDWYARGMYIQGTVQNQFHVARYGPPWEFGFKDVIHEWKAPNFDPDQLLAFYKRCGAQYFMAMANHHDNFDLYNSKYQPWNSVAIGPQKDIIGLWAAAARKHGLRFGVSVHASHAWTWYEPAQGNDTSGPLAGVPYDGNLTKTDGKGKWWEGLDPQDLYAQNHKPGSQKAWDWWEWDPGQGQHDSGRSLS